MPLPCSPHDLDAWLRLSLEPGVGPVTARELLARFGAPDQLYATPLPQLAAWLPLRLARQLSSPPTPAIRAAIEHTLAWCTAPGHHLLTLADPDYPPLLLASHDPPVLLYVVGDPTLVSRQALAVVGARNATPDGADTALRFARHLASQGWTIVSGLALGIDAAAHDGALQAGDGGAGTLAVMGTGVDVIYPTRNRPLAQRIAEGGALVSELPLGSPAIAHQFPRRNRLVAGLTRGVLVVEAAVHSGSLITARIAADIGREVFAIPGSIHSPLARGCHALIRQGAKLVETAQDILDELTPPGAAGPGAVARSAPRGARDGSTPTSGNMPSPDPQAPPDTATDPLLHALGHGPVSHDHLQRRTGLTPSALAARLLDLELAGRLDRLPGNRYQARAG